MERMLPVPASIAKTVWARADVRQQQRARARAGLRRRHDWTRRGVPDQGLESHGGKRSRFVQPRSDPSHFGEQRHELVWHLLHSLHTQRSRSRLASCRVQCVENTRGWRLPLSHTRPGSPALRCEPRDVEQRATQRAQTDAKHLFVQDAQGLLLEGRQALGCQRHSGVPRHSLADVAAGQPVNDVLPIGRTNRRVCAKRTRRITAEKWSVVATDTIDPSARISAGRRKKKHVRIQC